MSPMLLLLRCDVSNVHTINTRLCAERRFRSECQCYKLCEGKICKASYFMMKMFLQPMRCDEIKKRKLTFSFYPQKLHRCRRCCCCRSLSKEACCRAEFGTRRVTIVCGVCVVPPPRRLCVCITWWEFSRNATILASFIAFPFDPLPNSYANLHVRV